MELSFEQLKSMVVFAQVIEQGNFSAAAKHLKLSRAVVSYHLKKLETQLGIKLLNRSTRSIALTEAGEQYYQRCKVIVDAALAANQQIENLKENPTGLIKISCPMSVGLHAIVPALNAFAQHYPSIQLEVNLSDEVVNIIREGFDIAIRGAALTDSGLQATKLSSLTTHLYASPDYLTKYGQPSTPAQLASHQWVIYQLAGHSVTLKKGKRSYTVKLTGKISTNNAAARTAFVEGGHGIGRIPLYDAQPKLKQGSLVQVLADYQLNDIDVYAVFPPGGADSKKLRLLIDYLKDHFKKDKLALI
ncbi:LysR family transcriptional regulator [Psychromonas sp. 14N.309.X.WAT.B.A12]|uniref:LysR family transcriptional regulator n=1 Tax=unclassified Psychromonas TaxID=2614957 RepID=UPI0025B0B28F|nr:LysR family transcriptional regulator [Psychromonas sp. 14N.309.X.WAT.B.A12]MDN2662963.1 LysR family transcriptional regulator [Psychromonas sp. 14N.309.X.WAT.B.A12]